MFNCQSITMSLRAHVLILKSSFVHTSLKIREIKKIKLRSTLIWIWPPRPTYLGWDISLTFQRDRGGSLLKTGLHYHKTRKALGFLIFRRPQMDIELQQSNGVRWRDALLVNVAFWSLFQPDGLSGIVFICINIHMKMSWQDQAPSGLSNYKSQ